MTSKLTRERLQEIAEDGFLKHGESKELARMALAAMDSEPVAEVYQVPNVGICAALGPSIRMLCALEPGTKLYRHAQPAQVVPDELLKEYLRLVDCMLSDYRDSNYGDAQRWIRHIADASDTFEEKHGLSPWEMARKNFRTAMLSAAPQEVK